MGFPVSDATFCARCLEYHADLTPERPVGLSERKATPKFCPECLKAVHADLKRQEREAKTASKANANIPRPSELYASIAEEDRVRPYRKLLRAEAPPYTPAPVLTSDIPNVLHDSYSDLFLGMRRGSMLMFRTRPRKKRGDNSNSF